LSTIYEAGLLATALVAPNVLKAMKNLGYNLNLRQREYVTSSASKMVKRGLLKFNGRYYELTPAGNQRMRRWELSDFGMSEPKRWDGKWRVTIFDISETKKSRREKVRRLFHLAGLVRLQDSVWVYPYDCEEIITLLKTDLGVGKNLIYMIADEIEGDKHLKKLFNISNYI